MYVVSGRRLGGRGQWCGESVMNGMSKLTISRTVNHFCIVGTMYDYGAYNLLA